MTVQVVPAYLQNASHSAAVFRLATSAPFATGGALSTGELAVSAQATPNMSIAIAPGRAMVPGTSVSPPSGFSFTTQGMYTVLNDAPVTVTVTTSDATNPRIDASWIGVQDAYYSGAANQALVGITAGVPAVSPVAPAIPANAVQLGLIAVAANVTTIVSANITSAVPSAGLISGKSGLVPIIPTSVQGCTVGPNGVILFSSTTLFSLNGAFSAVYDNYRIIVDIFSGSAGPQVQARMRQSGADYSLTNYKLASQQVATSGTLSTFAATGNSSMILGNSTTGGGSVIIDILGPYKGNEVKVLMTSSTSGAYLSGMNEVVAALAFDGISIYPSSGSFSGSARVYGYSNN